MEKEHIGCERFFLNKRRPPARDFSSTGHGHAFDGAVTRLAAILGPL